MKHGGCVATVRYFAYGANLHPLRLCTMVPSCEVVATAVLADHALRFHKRGRDGSAKCDAFPEPGAAVHGVVYRLDAEERPALDRGEGGYDRVDVTLQSEGRAARLLLMAGVAGWTSEAPRDCRYYRHFVAVFDGGVEIAQKADVVSVHVQVDEATHGSVRLADPLA